jgi:hypothetical protein
MSPNMIGLGVGFDGDHPVVGLHLGHDEPADRQAQAPIVEEQDEYNADNTIPSVVSVGAERLTAREWTYVYLRRDAD